MKYDVNDLTDLQINFLVAKAQGYEAIDHLTWVEIIPTEEVALEDGQEHILYDPISYWDQAGYLVDIYKPFINPITDGPIIVEILMDHSSNKDNVTLKYVVAKHRDNIRLALCKAIVAYHYGYAIEI